MRYRLRTLLIVLTMTMTMTMMASLGGCGSNKPTSYARSTGGGVAAGGREIKFAVDGPGGIAPGGERRSNGSIEVMPAVVEFTGGKVIIEKARVLLNDKEVAALPEGAKVVVVDYTGGVVTITADGTKVYAALRE